jgi:hypothetical protein
MIYPQKKSDLTSKNRDLTNKNNDYPQKSDLTIKHGD